VSAWSASAGEWHKDQGLWQSLLAEKIEKLSFISLFVN